MKGSIYEFWLWAAVLIFITAVSWLVLTPFFNTFSTTLENTGDPITHLATNQSYHDIVTYNNNMWNLWPIALIVVVFLFFFIVAYDEDRYRNQGGI